MLRVLDLFMHNVAVNLKPYLRLQVFDFLLKLFVVVYTFLEIMRLSLEGIVQVDLSLICTLLERLELVQFLNDLALFVLKIKEGVL